MDHRRLPLRRFCHDPDVLRGHRAASDATSPSGSREVLENPGFGKTFTDHMVVATWTGDGGWARRAGPALRSVPARPGGSRAALRAGDLRGHEGLPARGRLGLDLPPRGQRGAVRPRRHAASRCPSCPRPTSSSRCASSSGRPGVGARPATRGRRASTCARSCLPPRRSSACARPSEVTYSRHRLARPAPTSPAASSPSRCGSRTDYARAGAGGTGAAKCGGNYASSLAGPARGHRARLRPGGLPRLLDAHLHRGARAG